MKNRILSLILVVAFLVAVASPAFAGGDQARGEYGQGSVNQVQVQDPPPFQP